MKENNYDLIVVGTSFSSVFFLKKYLEYGPNKVRILVLERGMHLSFLKRLEIKRKKQSFPNDFLKAEDTFISDDPKFWDFEPNFGGSSNKWYGCTPRFLPSDFNLNSKYGVGLDWPINYEDLEPWYDEAEEIMSICGPKETPFPRKKDYPLPPHQLSTLDKVIQKEYGDLYISQPSARPSIPLENRSVCCSSAICGLCPVDSKFTIENSLIQIFDDPRVELSYGCQVYNLGIENNLVKNVEYRKDNKDYKVNGSTVVLGANPIFNSHILLNSGDDNKHTGKGISEQVGIFARINFEGIDNLGGGSVISANGYMMYDGDHRKDYAGCIIESFNTPFVRNEKGKWRQMGLFKFIFEDLPSDQNRVELSDDPLKPRVIYKGHSDYVNKGLQQLHSNITEVFSRFPMSGFKIDPTIQPTESHICGTTKMSDKPEDGVIDQHMIHHKFRNLLVLGSGAYPAISPSNPTLTLSALSLMAADNYFQLNSKQNI